MMIIITSRHCDSHQEIIAITFSCRRVRHSKLGAWHKKVVELVCLIVLMIITIFVMLIIIVGHSADLALMNGETLKRVCCVSHLCVGMHLCILQSFSTLLDHPFQLFKTFLNGIIPV